MSIASIATKLLPKITKQVAKQSAKAATGGATKKFDMMGTFFAGQSVLGHIKSKKAERLNKELSHNSAAGPKTANESAILQAQAKELQNE